MKSTCKRTSHKLVCFLIKKCVLCNLVPKRKRGWGVRGGDGVGGGREVTALAYLWPGQKQLLIVGMYVLLVKRPQGPAHMGP